MPLTTSQRGRALVAQCPAHLFEFVHGAYQALESAFEMLCEIQPVMRVLIEALQDGRDIAGNKTAFVVANAAPGPVHQLLNGQPFLRKQKTSRASTFSCISSNKSVTKNWLDLVWRYIYGQSGYFSRYLGMTCPQQDADQGELTRCFVIR